jgi:hypothetical protein
MRRPLATSLALAMLTSARGAAAADVIAPPTLVLDWLHLGLPLGIVAGLVLLAASIGVGMHMRGRGRSLPASIGLGIGTFLAGDIAIYLLWVTLLRRPAGDPGDFAVPRPEPTAGPASSSVKPDGT